MLKNVIRYKLMERFKNYCDTPSIIQKNTENSWHIATTMLTLFDKY